MNRLSNFSDLSLTRSEMRRVRGGDCAVCSIGGPSQYGPGGTCGSYTHSPGAANGMADEFNSYNDGYEYVVKCN